MARGMAPSRRIAVVASDAGRLLHLRAPLLAAIAAQGHKLLCLTGSAGKADIPDFAELGAEHASFPLGSPYLRTLGDRNAIEALRTRLTAWQPNVVLGIGLKPMVLAARASARIEGGRRVLIAPSLTGLSSGPERRPGIATRWLVQRAFNTAHALVVYNSADEARLRDAGVVPGTLAVHVLPGAGVDLARFAPLPLPPLDRGLVFLMLSQRRRNKGVIEFCEAARRVKAKAPGSRFVLATNLPSDGMGDIDTEQLRAFEDCVEMTGAADDARALIGSAHVFVLPSYSEGLAQEVVEALACGRPAITTDVPGCRETVDERVSGVLVPPRDVMALAAAMEGFLRRPDLIPWMAQASRHKAERRFDVQTVNDALLRMLGLSEKGVAVKV